jgi:hypothetical protein
VASNDCEAGSMTRAFGTTRGATEASKNSASQMGHSICDVGETPIGSSRCDEQRGQRVIDAMNSCSPQNHTLPRLSGRRFLGGTP